MNDEFYMSRALELAREALPAEAADLPEELYRIVTLLPPGDYTRARLCTQLNSAIAGHAWGQVYGTVE